MDRTGYQRTTSGLCSKMPPTTIWRLFVHTPIAGATDSDRFSRGWVPLLPPWVFLRRRQGEVKRERLNLLDLKTYCQFCSHKRKTVLLVQSDAGQERKKLSKGVCVRVMAFLPMVCYDSRLVWSVRYAMRVESETASLPHVPARTSSVSGSTQAVSLPRAS